ncbi:MAG: glutamate--ammonia ligase [Succinivibrionaceae bacterium]|nr:glutamate--ammonia ligase [Succinivibrionaceae bacterium]
MSDAVQELLKHIEDEGVKFVDLRFTDTRGKEHHITLPVSQISEDFFEDGKMFDGSSIAGWKGINKSDMVLMPDPTSWHQDPFYYDSTVFIRCDILEPKTMTGYDRDPRSIAKRAEEHLKSTGIADSVIFGPEPEFFIFDDIKFENRNNGCFYEIDAYEGAWNSGTDYEDGNLGHRPFTKGGYFPVPPVDPSQDLRSEICIELERLGMIVEAHHHEVASGGQNEIATRFNTLTKKADELLEMKYVISNVCHRNGKTATFMPKPIFGDNGSGMHCNQSLSKDGKNLFAGDGYGGLSQTAIYYIGGIIRHAKALNAFTNPSTNSYKRLVPGFEAPVMLAYSASNRSASIRIPAVSSPKATRVEVRFPDCMANPYLAFSAMLMAGLDGIQNKIDPGEALDKNLYDLPPEEAANVPQVCGSLEEALNSLAADHEFLTRGGVFTEDFISSYIELKKQDVSRVRMAPHPLEFELYYSL